VKVGDRVRELDPLTIAEDGVGGGTGRFGTVRRAPVEGYVKVKWDDESFEDTVSVMYVEVLNVVEGLGSLLDYEPKKEQP